MNKSVKQILASVVMCAMVVTVSYGTAVPFSDDFETGSIAADWVQSSPGAAEATTDVQTAGGSTYSMKMTNTAVTLTIDGARTNTWVNFYTKPGLYAGTPDSLAGTGTPAAMCITASGDVMAWTGAWSTVHTDINYATGWQGFSIHLDYTNNLWDIYHTSANPGADTVMAKLNAMPLPFDPLAPSNTMHQFSIDTELLTYVDDTALSIDLATLEAGSESPSNVASTLYITFEPAMLASALSRYFTDENNTLAGTFGLALGSGLDHGDRVHVYDNGGDTYHICSWVTNSPAHWNYDSGPAASAADVIVSRTTGMWVETDLPTIQAGIAFASFDDNAVSDTTIPTLWSQLKSPYTADKTPNTLELPGDEYGDLMYVYSNGQYVRLWWDDDNGKWMRGASASTLPIVEGQGLWRYNPSLPETWTVTQ